MPPNFPCRFRWAVCQFDILRRLKSRAAIDAALNTLPETLDETYERILSNIEPKDRQILRRALLMLCGRAKYSFDVTLGVCEFLSIVLAAEEDFIKHPDNNLYDIGILQDICGCLMKVAGPLEDDEDPSDDKVYLAHYTVAEFILSSRSASSPIPTVAYFGISSADLDCEYGLLIFQAALAYSKQPVGSRLIHRDFIDEHCTDCLHQFENRELTEWTAREISDLTPLIWDLAGLGSLNGEAWFGNLPEQLARELGDFESSPERYSDVYVFYTLICNDWSTLVELFVEAKSSSIFDLGARRNGIALLNEYWLFDVGSHRLLGAERHTSDICQTIGPTRSLLLHLGIHRHDRGGCSGFWSGAECPISAFLKAGADANCTQYDKTPLQLAVERFDNTAVDLFLRNNADPNLVGPDDGAQLCGREFTQERRNWSPLRLCRQAPCVLRSVMSDFGKPPKDLCFGTHSRECESRLPDSRRGIIEQMLLERGARDFVVSPDGVEIGF